MKNIVIFASGRGSNAIEIINHFKDHPDVGVAGIISNNRDAGIIQVAETHGIDYLIIDRDLFYHSTDVLAWIKERNSTLIVLAGFLWLIPNYLIEAYDQRIVNIHPALLPKYGGKGMYGHHVHRKVFEEKENISGMTIHFVNPQYDEGDILFQVGTDITTCRSSEEIGSRVLSLEHNYYKEVIEELLLN